MVLSLAPAIRWRLIERLVSKRIRQNNLFKMSNCSFNIIDHAYFAG